jgi:hypothetical protein
MTEKFGIRTVLFGLTLAYVFASCAENTVAQDAVFNRLRQLPDLGACPSTNPPDPDLNRALTNAVAQAQAQAKAMADSVARMRDAGLASPDTLKQLADSADKLSQALNTKDACDAAKAFAKLSPGATVQSSTTQPLSATCDGRTPPCIYKPNETQISINGKLALDATNKIPDKTTAELKIGGSTVKVEKYNPDTGEFKQSVSALNGYNKIKLVQTDANGKATESEEVTVGTGVTCDQPGSARPCLNRPHRGETRVSGEIAVQNDQVASGTKVSIKVNDRSAADAAVDTTKNSDGKFTFKLEGLDPLPAGATVQADQTPTVTGSSNTTGPVLVQGITPREKISVSTDVLDFGHQSLQTASDSKPVTVTNNTGGPVSLQMLASTIEPRSFAVSGCPNVIEDKQQCTFNVKFSPFQVKPRERYLALVPSADSQAFEPLRADLDRKQGIVDAAEERWRVEARCADEKPDRLDSDCPEAIYRKKLPKKPAERQALETAKQTACAADPKKKDLAKDLDCPATHESANALYGKYQDARDEAARAEQLLRTQFNVITLKATGDHWKFPFTRAVVGLDMSAPTSRTVKQAYFVDFDLLAPLRSPFFKKNEDPLENRFWTWLNPRITSLPQATNFSAVSTIDETGSFFQSVSGSTLNKIANGLDVNGGLEIALVKPRDGIPWWGEFVNAQSRLSVSWILGGGVSTPFSTDSTEVQSAVTQAICDAFKAPASQQYSNANGLVCTYSGTNTAPSIVEGPSSDPGSGLRSFIDFYTPDRSRFFRRYYTGVRLKTYYFSRDVHSFCKPFESRAGDEGNCNSPYDIFPAIIDLTVGQDEAVTAGRFTGVLFRTEAVYPLPWYQGIHIFGSIYTKIQREHAPGQPFGPYTIQAPPSGGATDLNTFRFPLPPLDRDYFRVGVGVDLIQVFKKTGQPNKNAPEAPASADKQGKGG